MRPPGLSAVHGVKARAVRRGGVGTPNLESDTVFCPVLVMPRVGGKFGSGGAFNDVESSTTAPLELMLYLRGGKRIRNSEASSSSTMSSSNTASSPLDDSLPANSRVLRRAFFATIVEAEKSWVQSCGTTYLRETNERKAKRAAEVAEALAASRAAHRPARSSIPPPSPELPIRPALPHKFGQVPTYITARKTQAGLNRGRLE
ncbi:hypothetical protein HDU93_005883 [Gonapodya sp. JEL0774]|nr:hypothetical protein HDU93_005883 [Gonapodya sp. JEL0774]